MATTRQAQQWGICRVRLEKLVVVMRQPCLDLRMLFSIGRATVVGMLTRDSRPHMYIFGALILLSPLREPPTSSADAPTWMPEKTEAERQQIIAEIRTVEVKWAKRCLWAIVVLIIVSAVAAVFAWAVMRSS